MHRCLLIPEILSAVLEQDIAIGDEKTVANVAISCRAFLETALDVLWCEQVVLAPLVRCMPSDLWSEDLESNTKLTFRRPLVETDWTRFNYYAPRIKRLGVFPRKGYCSSARLLDVHAKVYCALSEYRPTFSFLPNLCHLQWDERSDEMFVHIQAFIGISLKYFQVNMRDDMAEHDILSLVASLPRLSPHIQHLKFLNHHLFGAPTHTFPPTLSNAVCRLGRLRTLHCRDWSLSKTALLRVSFLPDLTSLELNILDTDLQFPSQGAFPSLRRFAVRTLHITTGISLLELMRSCPFEELEFGFDSDFSDILLEKFITTLRSHRSFAHLIKFLIYGRAQRVVNQTVFQPLLAAKMLQSVGINVNCALNNSWLKLAADAWPHLQRLTISPQATFTLQGLSFLATHQELMYLQLVVDARIIDCQLGDGVFDNKLSHLTLRGSTISDPRPVAQHLIRMFPNLVSSVCATYYGEDHDVDEEARRTCESWQAVDDLIEEARKKRSRGR